jgi:hypothetical protein
MAHMRMVWVALALAALLAVPAQAHLERPSYWPDPRPDTSVSPPAGGAVPKARSLSSALNKRKAGGALHVVCAPDSMRRAAASIREARDEGFRLRPSQPERRLSPRAARQLLKINQRLKARCKHDSVQSAVDVSRNNDRIVIMPGRYTEPESRKAPTNDPRCVPSLLQDDQQGRPTPSYAYHSVCPNDQNLVHVLGRAVTGKPVSPPRPDRHGIPQQELGACIRCNLQIEGSGVVPEDVVLDAGTGYERPDDPQDKPAGHAKHVVMRTDRTDGLVVRNMLFRGALEHGFYTEETDGVLLDKVKFFWNADYGHLSFTTDHNVIQECEAFGSGDAGVYPGASPQTGEFRNKAFYPEERFNTVVRRCDLHGSTLAYSGSMGNSVRITENHIYGNTAGISSDTLSSAGHPGFPADGMQIDNNYIYSNNLDLYGTNPPIKPLVPMPIGTGIVWPGMNGAKVLDNWIFDNWRHGTLLAAVPDEVAGDPEGNVDPGVHCQQTTVASTSCKNEYRGNKMGQVPPGFTWPTAVEKFGNKTGDRDAKRLPNGVDFWWDEFPGTNGNCWVGNTGPDGQPGSVTGSGAGLAPDPLPSACASSVGTGDVVKEGVLVDCVTWYEFKGDGAYPLCYWFRAPAKPGSAAAARDARAWRATAGQFAASPDGRALASRLSAIGSGTAYNARHDR